MSPMKSYRDISQTSPERSVSGESGIRVSFLSSELSAPPSNPKPQFTVKQAPFCS